MEKKEWYSLSVKDVEKELSTNVDKGLNADEISKRKEQYGSNEITSKNGKPLWKMIVEQFTDFMIIVLIIAAVVSAIASGEVVDSAIILLIVVVNAIIGVVQEVKAQKSLDSLKQLSAPHCKVVRDGKVETIESRDLVPGDIVILDTGDYVRADLRLVDAVNL